jgi:outer membrane protein OmpA-like peptidoglycan-associated protein
MRITKMMQIGFKLISRAHILALVIFCLFLISCMPFSREPRPGPDKQAAGTIYGAALGAGTGAITGAELTAGTGPGAAVGAGLGAVWGMMSGVGIDKLEEDSLRREAEERRIREISWVQEILSEHYERRLDLHPSRDIYPADWFFDRDSTKLKPEAYLLVREIAYLTRRRMPWSRLVITSYVTSIDVDSAYAKFLSQKRAEAIALEFIRSGIEARRVLLQGVILTDPILMDPDDSSSRYRQAIELIALDR